MVSKCSLLEEVVALTSFESAYAGSGLTVERSVDHPPHSDAEGTLKVG